MIVNSNPKVSHSKIPPSRLRYFKNHPSVNVRLKIQDLDALRKEAEKRNISVNRLVAILLTNLSNDLVEKERAVKEYYQRGYDEGKKYIMEKISKSFKCDYCKRPLFPFDVERDDPDVFLDGYLATEGEISHAWHYSVLRY
ncbi:MAG: hypothetical protein QW292_07350 [Candidatus Parvarchaeota archaeon]